MMYSNHSFMVIPPSERDHSLQAYDEGIVQISAAWIYSHRDESRCTASHGYEVSGM
jgi:hypothetical protein